MQNLEILNSLHGCFKIVKWIGFCQIYLLTSANTVTLYSIAFLSSVFLNLRRSCNSQLYFSIVFLNLRRRILSWISGLLFHLSLVSVLAAANVSPPSQLSLSLESQRRRQYREGGQHPGHRDRTRAERIEVLESILMTQGQIARKHHFWIKKWTKVKHTWHHMGTFMKRSLQISMTINVRWW